MYFIYVLLTTINHISKPPNSSSSEKNVKHFYYYYTKVQSYINPLVYIPYIFIFIITQNIKTRYPKDPKDQKIHPYILTKIPLQLLLLIILFLYLLYYSFCVVYISLYILHKFSNTAFQLCAGTQNPDTPMTLKRAMWSLMEKIHPHPLHLSSFSSFYYFPCFCKSVSLRESEHLLHCKNNF